MWIQDIFQNNIGLMHRFIVSVEFKDLFSSIYGCLPTIHSGIKTVDVIDELNDDESAKRHRVEMFKTCATQCLNIAKGMQMSYYGHNSSH